ncbi:hypothetical protein M514_02830 [Trichuris suis]|uniref:Uncharacterized protein n=1 Tax=Trichuris suis TaxID=68888 RepID=A0A085MGM9_9BILA|nr:hypothetical protein M513_02830 [Trichuris suis]KFD67941.1 hypothetical protein M514_02830 [Trichuris suis]
MLRTWMTICLISYATAESEGITTELAVQWVVKCEILSCGNQTSEMLTCLEKQRKSCKTNYLSCVQPCSRKMIREQTEEKKIASDKKRQFGIQTALPEFAGLLFDFPESLEHCDLKSCRSQASSLLSYLVSPVSYYKDWGADEFKNYAICMKACLKELKQRGITVVVMQPLANPSPSSDQSVPWKPPEVDPRVKGLSYQDIHPTQELQVPERPMENQVKNKIQKLREYVQAKDRTVETSPSPQRYQLPPFVKKYEVHQPSVQQQTFGRIPYTHNVNIPGRLQYTPSHQGPHRQQSGTKFEVYRPSVQQERVPHTHFTPTRHEHSTQLFHVPERSHPSLVNQQGSDRRASRMQDKSYGSVIQPAHPSVLDRFKEGNFYVNKKRDQIRVPRSSIFK